MSNPDEPGVWVRKADNDLLCIRNNLDDAEVPWDAVCFHAQQAAEKMLKAFLVSRGRTHDLPQLLAECAAIDGTFERLRLDCRLLNPYSVALRYPGAGPEPTEQDGRAASTAAEDIRNVVLNSLSSS